MKRGAVLDVLVFNGGGAAFPGRENISAIEARRLRDPTGVVGGEFEVCAALDIVAGVK